MANLLIADLLLKKSWSEIIFDRKNKLYGAFYLRQLYSKNIALALLIGISIFGGTLLASFLYIKSKNSKKEVFEFKEIPKGVTKKTPIEKPKDEVIPPPPPKEQKLETKAYPVYEPNIKELESKLNKMSEIDSSNAGTKDQEGEKHLTGPPQFDAEPEPVIQLEKDEEYGLEDIEENPEFPGGFAAMNEFFAKHLVYPRQAIKMGISGNVPIMFSVEKDGTLSNIRVAREIDPLLDNEALRVIKMMPKWTTGKVGGKSVKVNKVTIPVRFQLGE